MQQTQSLLLGQPPKVNSVSPATPSSQASDSADGGFSAALAKAADSREQQLAEAKKINKSKSLNQERADKAETEPPQKTPESATKNAAIDKSAPVEPDALKHSRPQPTSDSKTLESSGSPMANNEVPSETQPLSATDDFMALMFAQLGIEDAELTQDGAAMSTQLDSELTEAASELDALLQGSIAPEILNELSALMRQWQQGEGESPLPDALQNLLQQALEQLQQGADIQLDKDQLATLTQWLASAGVDTASLEHLTPQALTSMLQQTMSAAIDKPWHTLPIDMDDKRQWHAALTATRVPTESRSDDKADARPALRSSILGEATPASAAATPASAAVVNTDPKLTAEIQKMVAVESEGKLSDKQVAVMLSDAKLSVSEPDTKAQAQPQNLMQSLAMNETSRSQTVPQVQLSLRQQMDQQLQQHEMIQRFAPVMRSQLMTMVSQGVTQAEIRLDPPELGSMMIRIQVAGDQTQVQFQAASAQTRDMLEQAMPRLRDLLNEQGMQLADSHVSEQRREDHRQGQNEAGVDDLDGAQGENSAEELETSSNQTTSYRQGIDYYA
ncbi:flagellar hook-length control protein FliK [Shewanella sp. NIFS-20-20]|uniref:flagellar hook-length control protein FliK n=1 Tax=Shewanella sp. NIFS-20-20 TaxID=2853806 RepID=UPI001C482BFC|nr:flagellar hook-length control protein FliK [Shewanella sp. NIFS-20-20]MBV7314797.1 flagellar hook-length control protein FliK [Shewanella sp. NIFS-20-20]